MTEIGYLGVRRSDVSLLALINSRFDSSNFANEYDIVVNRVQCAISILRFHSIVFNHKLLCDAA
jgi:hypothetical protein